MTVLGWHRLQFAFTITFHYLFPQLTMGLALVLVLLKGLALRTGDSKFDDLARFWARIFGINFAIGVVTGVPMEFQFGTNWARFADTTGGVIGLTLALEGMLAFFAESAFLGLFLFGEHKLSRRGHFFAAVMVFLGSWLSGYFIVVTNAFMQRPVGYAVLPDGQLGLVDAEAYLFNAWAFWEYAHVMCAAVITGSFVVAAVSAYWLLLGRHEEYGRRGLRLAVILGVVATIVQLFPTGDRQGKLVARFQPPGLAAMEGKFASSAHAELAIVGQPNLEERRLENPVQVPYALSFLAYGSFGAIVQGLNDVPRDRWPDNVELLYYTYHVMVGLGTLLILVMLVSALLLWRGRLFTNRPMLWVLMLSCPFPYVATTAGWMTAEIGRQPWVVYGLLRTSEGSSRNVAAGDVVFSMMGYTGLYGLLGLLFVFLVARQIGRGPVPIEHGPPPTLKPVEA
jgi:cytochrome d ubiquinol oxidase subunit I